MAAPMLDYSPRYRVQLTPSKGLAKAMAVITENQEMPLQIFQENHHKEGYHYLVLSVTQPPVQLPPRMPVVAPPLNTPPSDPPRIIPATRMIEPKGGPDS